MKEFCAQILRCRGAPLEISAGAAPGQRCCRAAAKGAGILLQGYKRKWMHAQTCSQRTPKFYATTGVSGPATTKIAGSSTPSPAQAVTPWQFWWWWLLFYIAGVQLQESCKNLNTQWYNSHLIVLEFHVIEPVLAFFDIPFFSKTKKPNRERCSKISWTWFDK